MTGPVMFPTRWENDKKLCGARSEGRICLRPRGHHNEHRHKDHAWWSGNGPPNRGIDAGDAHIPAEFLRHWSVSQKLRDALDEASVETVRDFAGILLVDLDAAFAPLYVELSDWLYEIADIKEEGGAE